jgi:hypothetical protein
MNLKIQRLPSALTMLTPLLNLMIYWKLRSPKESKSSFKITTALFRGFWLVPFAVTCALTASGQSNNTPCVQAPINLVLWLPLDELGGTITANFFAGGNNGTLIDNPTHAGGFVGNCLCFNGTDQYVDVPDYPAINPGAGDLSLDAWVKRDPASGNTVRIIVDKRSVTVPHIGYSLSVSFGNLVMTLMDAIGQANYRDTGVVPADNAWHFVAVTISRTSTNGGTFYIDGNPTGTFDPTGHPGSLDNTSSFDVGRSPVDQNSPWLGCIDEVEMFDRALTTAEIRSIYYAGQAGKCKCACPTAIYTNGAPATIYGDPFVLVATHTNPIYLFGLTSDSLGRIFVGNNANSAQNSGMPVQVHIPAPVPTPPTGFTDLGTTLMGDADGISCVGNLLYVADPAGVQLFTLPNSAPGAGAFLPGVAANGDGSPLAATATSLFVGHGAFSSGQIDKYQLPSGTFVQSYSAQFPVETLAKDPSGDTIYYAPYGSSIYQYPLASSDTLLASLPGGAIDGGLTFDPISGQVLAGAASGGGLYSVDPNNPQVKLFANGFTSCSGILREPLTGDLYVLEAHALWRLCSNYVSKVVCGWQVHCPGNKTVECGSAWTFDQPTADSCCNLSITPTGATTNGVCQKIITQGWLVSDSCGHSQTCTQQVTVVDTTPPVIKCKSRTVIVTLNSNCLLVIPRIQLSATDNCTPASQLHFEQSPNAGTVVLGPSHVVTVTVTDACDNSSTCPVTVYGEEPAPHIRCPGAVTVSNCIVPDVTSLVPASGCSHLSYEQSPKAGTPMGPGINSVTVTVKNQNGGTASCVIPLQFTGPMSFLDQLYNTGVDDNRAKLANNAIDPHYTLPNPPPGTAVTSPGKAVATSWPWFASPNSSSWIAPTINSPPGNTQQPGNAHYIYVMNAFTLPPGGDPNTASISGLWAADNSATMYLNGQQVTSEHGFAGWTPFTISGPGLFAAYPGQNTLTFDVLNENHYTGLRVEITDAFVNCSNCAPPTIVSMTGNRSLPSGGGATFTVIAAGTPVLHYEWFYNGRGPLTEGQHYSGTDTPTLTVKPLGYGDGGTYTVEVGNACGVVSQNSKLIIVHAWPWPWGMWNFTDRTNAMAATVGPDLVLSGSNTLGIASGSTLDFGLPNPAGQIASAIYLPPLLPGDATIQLPFIAPLGSNTLRSYSLVMDIYAPSNSSGTVRTLFSNPGAANQNGYSWTIDAQDFLHLTGTVGGQALDVVSAGPIPLDAWNRLALIIDDPNDGYPGISMYLNGQLAGNVTLAVTDEPVDGLAIETNCPSCPPPPTVLSSTNGQTGEFYSSGVQFHAVALTPEIIAGFGSPDTGPLMADEPSVGVAPVLSVTASNGIVNLSWTGSPYILQETADLTTGDWTDSALPFDQSEVNGDILTIAHADPSVGGPARFYRLIFAP